jgi:pimeloyl-ACP methyl ester carboxylesterase
MRFVSTLLVCILVSLLLSTSFAERRPVSRGASDSGKISYEYFLQPTEQSQSSSARWKQRVLVNSEYATSADAPTFVYLGPAGRLTEESVTSGYVQTLAKTYGALLVAPEHRFHGESFPVRSLETTALKSHTVDNALGDVARFLQDFTVNGKKLTNVVLVGSEFGATLAAWLRVRHPNLSVGAIAASAIVNPLSPVFGAYHVSLGRAVTAAQRGESACATVIAEALEGIRTAVNDWHGATDRPRIAKEYRLCGSVPHFENHWQIQEIIYETVFAAVAESVRADKVDGLCELITAAPEEKSLWRLGRYISQYGSKNPDNCFHNGYGSYTGALNSTQIADNASGRRQALYLACTELGTFGASNPNTAEDPDFFKFLCRDIFGFTDAFERTFARVERLLQEFGGVKYRGDKVFFANAEIDALASDLLTVFESSPSSDVFALTSAGASRGAILGSDEGGSLSKDRATITAQVGKWLAKSSANVDNDIVSEALLRSLKLY